MIMVRKGENVGDGDIRGGGQVSGGGVMCPTFDTTGGERC